MNNIFRKIQKKILTGNLILNVEEIVRNKNNQYIVFKKVCEKDNKVKKGLCAFCKSCGIVGFAIIGEYPVTGEFNYMHYF